MTPRAYTREDYPDLCRWWIGHGREPEPEDALPGAGRPGFGCVVPGLAAGFVYATGTSLWLGPHCLVVNPELHRIGEGRQMGSHALDAVVAYLEALVATAGGGVLATFTEERPVIARARRHGFRLTGRHVALLGKEIPPAESAGKRTAGEGQPHG